MRHLVTSALILCALAIAAIITRAVRDGRLSTRSTRLGAAACAVGLAAMVLSDFPYSGNRFWADHSVLAATLSSLLLVGVVFLAYETQERTHQQRLAVSLSGAGLGGLVDHMVDVEVALTLATAPAPPDQLQPTRWSAWNDPDRPLRWLRNGREVLAGAEDPRRIPTPQHAGLQPWATDLVDQAIRRTLSGMRDWSTLVGRSDEGVAVLIVLSDLRSDLMALASRKDTPAAVDDLRWRCRLLALCFEQWSGAPSPRPEVLRGPTGLGLPAPAIRTTDHSLSRRLDTTVAVLGAITHAR